MSVSEGYQTYVIDQLNRVEPVTARRMFGGVGLYSRGLFFGLMDDDVTYLKVDDLTRGRFEAAGMGPFRPFPDQPEAVMQYYELPGDALEDVEVLQGWVREAVGVAARAKRKKRR